MTIQVHTSTASGEFKVTRELSARLMWLVETRMPAPSMKVLRNRSKRINQLVNRNTRGV